MAESPKKLGRYDILRVLGKGAMGVVYEGRDPNLDRRVAIKTVKVESLSDAAAAEYESRFRTEARSAARLQHPNIVSVYDSDRDGNVAFLVMEYIQGEDLKHHLDKGVRYSLEQSLRMIRDLLSGLDYAHQQKIVHRDVKPANMLIEASGRVKLTDFGVARIQDSGDATRTQGGMVGTLKYMSPEQVRGQAVDTRTDLFSVAIVLYQLLTDRRPFDGENEFSIIHQIIGHHPPAPSSVNSMLPSAIDAVVARALAKDKNDRFETARDFAIALQAASRKVSDITTVPPADPAKLAELNAALNRSHGSNNQSSMPSGRPSQSGSLTGSRSGTAIEMANATVSQEVELVYWKDVKDTSDPADLESYLARFPNGVYQDLAQRRLKRLRLAGATTDGSAGTYTSTQVGGPVVDLEATRMRSDPLASQPGASDPGQTRVPAAPQPPPFAPDSEPLAGQRADPVAGPTTTPPHEDSAAVQPVRPVAVAATEAATTAAIAAIDATPAATPTPTPASTPAPARSKRGWLLGGAFAVAVAAVVGINIFGGSGPEPNAALPGVAGAASAAASGSVSASTPAGSAPASMPAASASAAGAAMAFASAPSATSGAMGSAGSTAATSAAVSPSPSSPLSPASSAKASAAARAASQSRAALAAAKASSAAVSQASPAPVASQPAAPAAIATPGPSIKSAAGPREACENRVLFGFQSCMTEQCAKPVFSNHPACVERREMEERQKAVQQNR